MDGKSQAILLERSACDFQAATFCAWLKWRGGELPQPLFHFGAGPEQFLTVMLDAKGRLAIQARKSGEDYAIVAPERFPSNRWTHIAAAMDGANATLLIDGRLVAQGAFPVKPEDFLASAADRAPDHDYFGRDRAGRFFNGWADEIRVYSEALTPARVEAEAGRVAGYEEDSSTRGDNPEGCT